MSSLQYSQASWGPSDLPKENILRKLRKYPVEKR